MSSVSKELKYECHLFICTNQKNGKECCADKNGAALKDEVKKLCQQKFGRRVRVNASGCLGHCELGISAVIYPENKWFVNLMADDSQKLVEAVEEVLNLK